MQGVLRVSDDYEYKKELAGIPNSKVVKTL